MPRILLSFLFLVLSSSFCFAQQQAAPDPAVVKAEQLTQEIRAEERKDDFEVTGLKWLPWSASGKTLQDFIIKHEPNYKTLIGKGRYVDSAIYDIDQDEQPDIILFFWNNCGNQGCLYKIYYGSAGKRPDDFFGWEFVPYKKGVMLDHAYFSL